MEIPGNAKLTELLHDATPTQVRWVLARIATHTDAEAARAIGVDKSTVSRWVNKGRLDQAVSVLMADSVAQARAILATSAADAAKALRESLSDKRLRVQAANSILDRVGIAPDSHIDITSAGERIVLTVNMSGDGGD